MFAGPFLLLCFPLREVPLVFVVELVWWCWILSFCLSVKLLISLSNLNEILARSSNLGCRFFPFITLNISCHSLLACRVSAEKSAVNLMGVPLYVICRFSFFFLINLFLFIYLFLAVLGLRFCARAFSSCGEQGPLFIAVRGPHCQNLSCWGAQAPDAQAQ